MTTNLHRQTPPHAMTAMERRDEVAGLLALALVRLRTGASELDLGFSGHQRVHANPQAKEVDA